MSRLDDWFFFLMSQWPLFPKKEERISKGENARCMQLQSLSQPPPLPQDSCAVSSPPLYSLSLSLPPGGSSSLRCRAKLDSNPATAARWRRAVWLESGSDGDDGSGGDTARIRWRRERGKRERESVCRRVGRERTWINIKKQFKRRR